MLKFYVYERLRQWKFPSFSFIHSCDVFNISICPLKSLMWIIFLCWYSGIFQPMVFAIFFYSFFKPTAQYEGWSISFRRHHSAAFLQARVIAGGIKIAGHRPGFFISAISISLVMFALSIIVQLITLIFRRRKHAVFDRTGWKEKQSRELASHMLHKITFALIKDNTNFLHVRW